MAGNNDCGSRLPRAAAATSPARESRAAGRSDEIARAQEFEPMTQSTTRPTNRPKTPPANQADPAAPASSSDRDRDPGLGRLVRANRSTAELYEHAVRADEGLVAAEGPLVVRTGKHTGRSPQDKFIVREPGSARKIWWGEVNRPIALEHYDRLRSRLMAYVADRAIYAQDCFIGADPAHHRSLRVYTETAWASIFARNLFRRPSTSELAAFEPNF